MEARGRDVLVTLTETKHLRVGSSTTQAAGALQRKLGLLQIRAGVQQAPIRSEMHAGAGQRGRAFG